MAITGVPQGAVLLNLLLYKMHFGTVSLNKDKYIQWSHPTSKTNSHLNNRPRGMHFSIMPLSYIL